MFWEVVIKVRQRLPVQGCAHPTPVYDVSSQNGFNRFSVKVLQNLEQEYAILSLHEK